MPSKHKYPTIRLATDVAARLSPCNSVSASFALRRYFFLINTCFPLDFSDSEFDLLCDACNGWATQHEPPVSLVQGLALQVSDAISLRQLDQKWRINRDQIIGKLENLAPAEAIAIVNSIERRWANA